jgi:cytochrome c oxidase subunit 2
MAPADFDGWVAGQKAAAVTPPAASPADEGLTVFGQRGCGSCHTVQGVSAGTIGPNLTHFATRTTFAGSIFDNNDANLRTWLADPLGVKPGNDMVIPGGPLKPDEITKLIAYLDSLR